MVQTPPSMQGAAGFRGMRGRQRLFLAVAAFGWRFGCCDFCAPNEQDLSVYVDGGHVPDRDVSITSDKSDSYVEVTVGSATEKVSFGATSCIFNLCSKWEKYISNDLVTLSLAHSLASSV